MRAINTAVRIVGVMLALVLLWGMMVCLYAQEPAQPVAVTPVETLFVYAPMPTGALAVTACLGGHIISVIDMDVIGTDSLDEIVTHEQMHVEQAKRAGPGQCPKYADPQNMLMDEIEAYCASRPVRMRRPGWSKNAVDQNYVERLQAQFHGQINDVVVDMMYRMHCP